jgi:hypothetical protein
MVFCTLASANRSTTPVRLPRYVSFLLCVPTLCRLAAAD